MSRILIFYEEAEASTALINLTRGQTINEACLGKYVRIAILQILLIINSFPSNEN